MQNGNKVSCSKTLISFFFIHKNKTILLHKKSNMRRFRFKKKRPTSFIFLRTVPILFSNSHIPFIMQKTKPEHFISTVNRNNDCQFILGQKQKKGKRLSLISSISWAQKKAWRTSIQTTFPF